MIFVAEARARGITLPADADAADGIVIEQEAWLARKIGPLDGSRTETFYVGASATHGKLALARYTDAVTLTDGGTAVAADQFRLVDKGSAIVHSYASVSRWWMGPYLTATYIPTDLDEVRRVLFELVALAAQPLGQYESETIGAYSYRRGTTNDVNASRAALASSLIPTRDQAFTIRAVSRRLGYGDPVINRAEPLW